MQQVIEKYYLLHVSTLKYCKTCGGSIERNEKWTDIKMHLREKLTPDVSRSLKFRKSSSKLWQSTSRTRKSTRGSIAKPKKINLSKKQGGEGAKKMQSYTKK